MEDGSYYPPRNKPKLQEKDVVFCLLKIANILNTIKEILKDNQTGRRTK